jgi:SAM-dependent methyltransferase
MHQIQEPLYVYHFHDNNSFASQELNSWIQENTIVFYEKYIYQLMEKWASINGLLRLDLCGGHNPPPGYLSIDLERSNIVHDLNAAPWPLGDNTVGVVRAHDALEHLKSPITTMKEIYRILAPGGMLLSNTPSTDGRGAFQDPTHVSFWNSNSFWYYTKRQTAAYINSPVRFQTTFVKNYFPSDWHRLHEIKYVCAHLTALKGGHENRYAPGSIEI